MEAQDPAILHFFPTTLPEREKIFGFRWIRTQASKHQSHILSFTHGPLVNALRIILKYVVYGNLINCYHKRNISSFGNIIVKRGNLEIKSLLHKYCNC